MRGFFLPLALLTWGVAAICLRADAPGYFDAVALGLDSSGKTDGAAKLQAALDSGKTRIFFPEGTYLLGSVTLPAKARIRFDSGTQVIPDADSLAKKRLFQVAGDDVVIEGLRLSFPKVKGHELGSGELEAIIAGDAISNLAVSGLVAKRSEGGYDNLSAVLLRGCSDISISDCDIARLHCLVQTHDVRRLAVRRNKAVKCGQITEFRDGSEWLVHEGNWSSQVDHQCQWWGGDADTQKPGMSMGTVDMMNRNVAPQSPGFVPNAAGAYDIQVLGNYAEYGVTLAWGSKGRDVIISNNVARFMADMCYDAEGSENVVISNNIAIDAHFFGIGCFFWGNNLLISNNLIVSDSDGGAFYQGHFIRLQSPPKKEFGSGHVLITGNLCVAKGGAVRRVELERSRDVTISSNKFTNGRIVISDRAEDVGILNNEMIEDLPGNYPAVSGAPSGSLVIRGNTFRRQSNEASPVAGDAALSGFMVLGGKKIIEDNFIDGWRFSAWTGNGPGKAPRAIVRGNSVSGQLLEDKPGRVYDENNLLISDPQPISFRPVAEGEAGK